MNAVKLVTVFVENKLGQLARITKVLADAGANIRWVTISTSVGFGVIKILADKCDVALAQLKEHGFTVSCVEVLAIEVQDKPGGLNAVAELLSSHGINVENASGFVVSAHKRAVLLLESHDLPHARQVLQNQGAHLLTQEEMLNL